MATEMLASMVREQTLYSSPPALSHTYHPISSACPWDMELYTAPVPDMNQYFSMKDFEHHSDGEEPPLIDTEELFAPPPPQPHAAHRHSTINVSTYDGVDVCSGKAVSPKREEECILAPQIKASMLPDGRDIGSSSQVHATGCEPKIEADTFPSSAAQSSSRRFTPAVTNPRKHARSHSASSTTSTVPTLPLTPPATSQKPVAKKRRITNALTASTYTPLPTPIVTTKNQKSKSKAILPCPFHHFGCISTFPNKNEWKRHTLSQHLRLGFYRCSLGTCNIDHPSGVTASRGYNDFNRKDLFIQHVRRMHSAEVNPVNVEAGRSTKAKKPTKPGNSRAKKHSSRAGEGQNEEWIEDVRREAWFSVRMAPGGREKVGCGFCDEETFGCSTEDLTAQSPGTDVQIWENRMEHIAWHYTTGSKAEDEKLDAGFMQWAVREGLVVPVAIKEDGTEQFVLTNSVLGASGDDYSAGVTAGLQGRTAEQIGEIPTSAAPGIRKTGIRRKGKGHKASTAVARSEANATGRASTARALAPVPPERKSARLSSGAKRSYTEYEEDEWSTVDSDDIHGSQRGNSEINSAKKQRTNDNIFSDTAAEDAAVGGAIGTDGHEAAFEIGADMGGVAIVSHDESVDYHTDTDAAGEDDE